VGYSGSGDGVAGSIRAADIGATFFPLVDEARAGASFSVTATGTSLIYPWKKGGTNIGGATAARYSIPTAAITDTGLYSVLVTSTVGNTHQDSLSASAHLAVSIAAMPIITSQPHDTAILSGAGASFSVTATGTSLTYQWKRNGTNIPS